MVYKENLQWNMISLALSGKMIFVFLKNMILFFRHKMKSDLSQEVHKNMIFSSNLLKRWSLQKKNLTGIWSVWYFLERWYFFYPKICFFIGRKMKDNLSQEMHGNMIFSVCMYKGSKYYITLLPRKSKTIFSRENTLKSDWRSILKF